MWCVCNVFLCCVLRGSVWCCDLWCLVRYEICVVYSFVTPFCLLWRTLSLSFSLSLSLSLSLSYLSKTLAITMTMITRPVRSLFVHTTLTCPECQSVWTLIHSMFQRKFQIKKENSQGSSCVSLVSHVMKWMFFAGAQELCVCCMCWDECVCVWRDVSVAWWLVVATLLHVCCFVVGHRCCCVTVAWCTSATCHVYDGRDKKKYL